MGDSRRPPGPGFRPPQWLAELLIAGPSPRPILPGILGHQVCARWGPECQEEAVGAQVGCWGTGSAEAVGISLATLLWGIYRAQLGLHGAFGTGSSPHRVWIRPLCLWWSWGALPKLDPSPLLALPHSVDTSACSLTVTLHTLTMP